jgi:phenylacetate-CoA ligase
MLMKLFWSLPYPLKCLAASVQARRWDRQRHGPAYDAMVAALRAQETWTRQRLAEHQASQLQHLLIDAARHVPYYREMLDERGIDPASISGPLDLARFPILEKETVRSSPMRLIDERLTPFSLIRVSTSGTTGTPLSLFSDVGANSARHAFMDARCRAVAGVMRRRDRSVSLCGHLVASPDRRRPPFWVHNGRWKQLYLSSYHLSSSNLDHYVEAIRRFRGRYIEGYPSSVFALAHHIIDRGLEPVPFSACITTAEVLSPTQRSTIAKAFCCNTFNQYGCAEMAVFAAECPAGTMHLSPEMSVVEVVDDGGAPVPTGTPGHLICTGLVNRAQPLIRYRLGDTAALSDRFCECGSPLPVLERIDGRSDDVVVTPDGRRVGRLDPVLKGVEGVVESQIVQERIDLVVIRIVPSSSYSKRATQRLTEGLRQRLGPEMRIEIEEVQAIERTRRGKLRLVISRLPPSSSPGSHTAPGR